jgi:NitT/TauT family transport system ATP-binding protein
MKYIEIKNLSKSFHLNSKRIEVLNKINLDIRRGEFITILGPNGCGKTTFLNAVSGIDSPSTGCVTINKKMPDEATVGYVFQNYRDSMLPWRTVLGNVKFGLELQNIEKHKREEIAKKILKKFNLLEHQDKYFYQLSGGMSQLVSIIRALILNPDLMVMDEPFSALDHYTRINMILGLSKIWEEQKITTLFVSHDIDEAIFLADRIMIFSHRPARVKKVIRTSLPRPRNIEMIYSERFSEIRNEIMKNFKSGLA